MADNSHPPLTVPEHLWERAEKLAEQGIAQSAERVILTAAEKAIALIEERMAGEKELDEADLWEAALPEEVQRWWYSIGQMALGAVWEHPEEDVYTLADGSPA